MKKLLLILAVAISTASCVDKKPVELYVPKNTVEFAGNAFASFSLGADVKLFTAQDPDDPTSEAAMKELLKLSHRKDLQEEIVKILAEAAEGGNLPAKKLMANFYRTGSGVEQNLPKAGEYYWATESLEEL
ncbi:MAG: sel1 repeat family protein, partial [Bacteroidales bacterium]|nr:sel1 repeat family protein [Bacteroidales bacterium]